MLVGSSSKRAGANWVSITLSQNTSVVSSKLDQFAVLRHESKENSLNEVKVKRTWIGLKYEEMWAKRLLNKTGLGVHYVLNLDTICDLH